MVIQNEYATSSGFTSMLAFETTYGSMGIRILNM